MPLGGHRDDSQYHPDVREYSTGNAGNFIELLNYRVRGENKDLEKHLESYSKNESYQKQARMSESTAVAKLLRKISYKTSKKPI